MARDKIKLYKQKRSGNLEYAGHYWETVYSTWLSRLKDGEVVEVDMKVKRPEKTNPQLRYWYGILMPFASREIREIGYDTLPGVSGIDIETTEETCDLFFKALFKTYKNLDHMPKKRNLSDEQMSELIDFTVRWIEKNLQVKPPSPEQDAKNNARDEKND